MLFADGSLWDELSDGHAPGDGLGCVSERASDGLGGARVNVAVE